MSAPFSKKSKPYRLLIEHLKRDDNVDFAVLFGSQGSGKAKPESDLDVAVYFKDPPQGMAALHYINTLSEAAGEEVDVSVLNRASAFLRHQVFKTGVPLVIKDPVGYRRFREKTITDYQEYKYVSGMPAYD
jgi:hypothetical protein